MKNEIGKPEKILHAGRNAKLGIEFARPKGRYVDSTGLHLRIFIMKLCTFGQVVAWKVRCTTPPCVCVCVRACVCVLACGRGQCFPVLCCTQRLHVVTPGQLLLCDSWLKPIADCP